MGSAILKQRLRTAFRIVSSVLLTFFGLMVVTFFIGRVLPIDPLLAVVGDRAAPDVYALAKARLGLDLPLYVQFYRYVIQVLAGDFGKSLLTARYVIDDIKRVFPATLELATTATLFGVVIGVPMGVMAAVKQGRLPDQIVRVLGLFGYSIPVFWLGLMGLLLFYGTLEIAPGPGRVDIIFEDMMEPRTGLILIDAALEGEWDIFVSALRHLVLPAAILGYASLAYVSRMTRSFMLEQLGQEYITTARVKGLSERRVIWRHALGNVLVPLITVIALSYANLLEGAVLTETVFAWPGIGQYLTRALLAADMNAVLGATIVVGMVYIGVNLLSDLLYRMVDPRAR
ncbi:MAG: ABC transporter permease [Proteobacteria bacterium]|nr:ABC transporter permease [Pseudomonadota bacterium]MBI3496290.1 ABC transporter permease [Pseudomonadota bacterium]